MSGQTYGLGGRWTGNEWMMARIKQRTRREQHLDPAAALPPPRVFTYLLPLSALPCLALPYITYLALLCLLALPCPALRRILSCRISCVFSVPPGSILCQGLGAAAAAQVAAAAAALPCKAPLHIAMPPAARGPRAAGKCTTRTGGRGAGG